MAVNSTAAAKELGAQLRAWREAASLNTRQMAELVGVSNANISHWETGNRLVPLERLAAYLDALAIAGDDRERVLGLRRRAGGPGDLGAGIPSIGPGLTQLIEYEKTASRILQWSPLRLPGLLQTSDIARIHIGPGPDIETKITLRAGRRDILTRKRNPVTYVALIDSEVLARPVAPAPILRDQLEFMLEMGELPNVTIRILPSTTSSHHHGLAGSFILLDFPKAQPVVHLEHYRTTSFVWDEALVADYIELFNSLEEISMSAQDTTKMIKQVRHRWSEHESAAHLSAVEEVQ